ncbi:hypothetical protein BFJ63_vAg5869 [Fusarium oxysporum f. sp. narcissi]|uniref:Uncharacterized protein n=2 Tax=Fusarium oxysporum TaxID=5507 RepID=A0A420PKQ4_FUSOX|nr:hypothetical protein BFJ71_g9857 [Fusarium oxysporum]RKL02158.1 hypothetical protein BFJ68_g12074 [Fusarium oxysporum]RYC91281.1 hypothetical protein BFJ63_vAg5869 [Fusarium oxysporum f. sp. narcissi]
MGVLDEDGERQLSEPPATREESISLLTKAFTALSKGAGNPLGIVALRIHAEGRPKHHIQIRSEVEERSTMRSTWQCSNDTFFVAMQSLVAAKLQTQYLNLFHDADMKLFALAGDQLNLIFPNWKILQYVSELPSLPRLSRLALRFQLMKESIVLNLLKRTRPGGLFIGPMWLDAESFKPIFEFCSSQVSNMQKLEARGPIYQMGLEERGQVHFQRQPYDEDAECCVHLRRQGEGVRRPIHFHLDPQGFVDLLLVNSEFDSSQAHTF